MGELCEGSSLQSQASLDLLHCSGSSSNCFTSSEGEFHLLGSLEPNEASKSKLSVSVKSHFSSSSPEGWTKVVDGADEDRYGNDDRRRENENERVIVGGDELR